MAATDDSQQSHHRRKFDRQIRLVGEHGQAALETGRVAVLGSGPVATETVKNLVLPNVGGFTIVDDALVTAADLGNNFFVTADSVGKPRAEVACENLVEMNADVKGVALVRSPASLLENDASMAFFDAFQLVITTQLWGEPLRRLEKYLWARSIPLLVLRANGLLGYARVSVPEHAVIESHPENDRQDLYIHPEQLALFPELATYCRSFDLGRTSDAQYHGHIPLVAVLVQAVDQWRAAHEDKLPASFDEGLAFADAVRALRLGDHQLNFAEALRMPYKAYRRPAIDDEVQAVLAHAKAQTPLAADTSVFWLLAAALREFTEARSGFLPVSTDIPDMTSLPESYVQLKQLYATRAAADVDALLEIAARLAAEHNVEAGKTLQREQVERVAKNARSLSVTLFKSMADECSADKVDRDAIAEEFFDLEAMEAAAAAADGDEAAEPRAPKPVHWYIGLRAEDAFRDAHAGRFPGSDDASVDADTAELQALAGQLMKQLAPDQTLHEGIVPEIVRMGGSEIHVIAAFLGGLGAGEAMKLLTRQYIPMKHTVVYDGVHGVCGTFDF